MQRVLLLAILTVSAIGLFWLFGVEDFIIVDTSVDNSQGGIIDTGIQIEEIDGTNYIYDAENEIYVVLFSQDAVFGINYEPNTTRSVEDTALDSGLSNVINGGFFTPTEQHAGLLMINGEQVIANAPGDNQVTHVAIFNNNRATLEFVRSTEFKASNYSTSAYTAFQSGPLIIADDIVQTNFIDNSLNGAERTRRSLLGVNENQQVFFITTRLSYSLEELASILLEMDELGTSISILNLDGGSSVALYSADNKSFQIGESKTLPILLYHQ